MSNTRKEVHDSEYNRKLIKVTREYAALLKIQLKTKVKKMKEGAWNIANASNNPKLKEVCRELDKLELK